MEAKVHGQKRGMLEEQACRHSDPGDSSRHAAVFIMQATQIMQPNFNQIFNQKEKPEHIVLCIPATFFHFKINQPALL